MSDDRLSRAEIEGRGNGDGRWLEHQLQRALRRWGYLAETRQTVYGLEVDVVARRKEKQNRPTDWIVGECKDWETRPITADVLYRLCMLAYTCRAMPVLCHTTTLTAEARKIARTWEVRVLSLEDLHRGALPAPAVCKPTTDLSEVKATFTARERRGRLPMMFTGEPNKHFTYVPGFECDGRTHEFRPIEDAAEPGGE